MWRSRLKLVSVVCLTSANSQLPFRFCGLIRLVIGLDFLSGRVELNSYWTRLISGMDSLGTNMAKQICS